MNTDFEYFFWGIPVADKPAFALFDVFDNHFMLLSDRHDQLFAIRNLFRSKCVLDIVELTSAQCELVDNSVIENWGLTQNTLIENSNLFGDINFRWTQNNIVTEFYEQSTVKNPTLQQTNIKFDNFKTDLQQQLFFAYYCVNENAPTDHLQQSIELGVNYADTVERFLDLTGITDKNKMLDMLLFLRRASLFYE